MTKQSIDTDFKGFRLDAGKQVRMVHAFAQLHQDVVERGRAPRVLAESIQIFAQYGLVQLLLDVGDSCEFSDISCQ